MREPGDLCLVVIRIEFLALHVAGPEWNAQAQQFDVDPPPAAGAVINDQLRETPPELAPKLIKPLDVLDLGDPLAVGRVIGTPVGKRFQVEILTVYIEPLFFDHPGDELDRPVARFGIAEIEEQRRARLFLAEIPVRMFLRQPGAIHGALGFHPEQQFHRSLVNRLGNFAQSVGPAFGMKIPVPRVDTPIGHHVFRLARLLDTEPTGVNPIDVKGYFLFDDVCDAFEMLRLGHATPISSRRRRDDRFAVVLRSDSLPQKSAQNIVAPHQLVARIPDQIDGRQRDAFAR